MAETGFQQIVRELLAEDLRARAPYIPEVPASSRVGAASPVSESRLSFERQAGEPLDPLGLLRRGDVLPGPQQALAAKDVADVQALREQLPEDAPWYADPLLQGAEGLAKWGLVPALGGMTAMPRRAALNLAEDLFKRRGTGGSLDVATGTDVPSGFMVGRGSESGTELVLPPGAGPPEVADWLTGGTPFDVDRPGTVAGIWGDPATGQTYVDLPERITGPQLERFAEGRRKLQERGEIAGFDIETGQTVDRPPGIMIPGATHRAYEPLERLEVAQAGTNRGLRGAERARAGAPYFAPPKGFLGVPGVYRGEPGLGPEFHTADLSGIFDPRQEPEVLASLRTQIDEAMGELGSRDPLMRATLTERALMNMGYTGAVDPQGRGVVSVFEDVPLQYGGRIQGPYLGPQYGLLAGLKGQPRAQAMPETPLRRRRFAQQAARQEQLFPTLSSRPDTPVRPQLPATPKRGTRTTVQQPLRKEYPGIYQSEPEIMEQAAGQWRPESPYLRETFGVSRADVDEGYRELERRLGGRAGQRFAPVTARTAAYPEQVMGEANTRRLRNILGLAGEDPRFAGAYGWYWNEPLMEDYIRLLGPDEGMRQFRRFHQQGAALSPGSAVPQEIERASLYNWLARQGDPEAFTSGEGLLPGTGHIYHTGTHRKALERAQRTGSPFETGPMQAAKTKAYYGARTGENVWSPIMDAHFVRGIGLSDVRPATKATEPGASIGEREAGRVADWYARQVAQPVGMGGVGAQALQWNVLGPQTGVKSPLGAPFMEVLADLAAAKGRATGQTPREALDAFILGQQELVTPR